MFGAAAKSPVGKPAYSIGMSGPPSCYLAFQELTDDGSGTWVPASHIGDLEGVLGP